jgi:hypothetical protein
VIVRNKSFGQKLNKCETQSHYGTGCTNFQKYNGNGLLKKHHLNFYAIEIFELSGFCRTDHNVKNVKIT